MDDLHHLELEADAEHVELLPTRDWTRAHRRRQLEAPLLLHWVDDKGSVVRLMSSTPPDVDAIGGA